MAETRPISSDKYEGPSTAAVTLGEGKLYGWLGSLAGAAIGFLSSGIITKQFPKLESRAADLMKRLDTKVTSKTLIRIAGALGGSFIGHYVGMFSGWAIGWKNAERGQKQFEQIKTERDIARAELEQLKSAPQSSPKKFADEINSRADTTMAEQLNLEPTSDATITR